MESQKIKFSSTLAVPALLCALTGGVLAMSLEWMGLFKELNENLVNFLREKPILLLNPVELGNQWSWTLLCTMNILVAYFVLTSVSYWQRCMVGLMAMIVIVGFTPCFALWNILWLPLVTGISVLWTWVCASLYAGQKNEKDLQNVVSSHSVEIEDETIQSSTQKTQ